MRYAKYILLFLPILASAQNTQSFKWAKTDTVKSRTGTGQIILADSSAYILYPSGGRRNLDSVGAGGSGETNDGVNMGATGFLPYKDKSGVNIRLRTLFENNTNLGFTGGTDSTELTLTANPQFDTLKLNTASSVHRLTVNGQGLFYGSFGAINLWQSTSGLGYRFTLNNDTTFRLQRNTTAFSGGTTTTPLLFDNANNVTFSNNVTATKAFLSDTIKPLISTGTLIIRGGDGTIMGSDDSSGVAVKFLNGAGVPFLKVIADSQRPGFKAGDDKVANQGSNPSHVNILDPLWVEESFWADEDVLLTAKTLPGSSFSTTLVETANTGVRWFRVASTTGFDVNRSVVVGSRATDTLEVHRVSAVSGDTIFTHDKVGWAHPSGTTVTDYVYKGSIFPIHYDMWKPGGHLFIGADAVRAEVDAYTPQSIEKGRHVMYADHLGKLFGPTVIEGGRVDTTSPASMGVDVDSGSGLINKKSIYGMDQGYTFAARTQNSITIAAADNDSNRTDLVYWDSAGVARVSTGALASPGAGTAPTLPSNCLSLATIAVAAGATSITSANITDTRLFGLFRSVPTTNNNFVVTASDKNIDRSTPTQAGDTSAFSVKFTSVGRPSLRLTGQTGLSNLFIDTTQHVYILGNFIQTRTTASYQMLQSAGGVGFRSTLNNDGTLRWQYTNNGFTSGTNMVMLDTLKNFNMNGLTASPTSAVGVLSIKSGTAPTAISGAVASFYSTSAGEMVVMDSSENATTISPHNFSGIPGGPSEEMAWSFYSERDGKYITVDMLRVVRLLEELTGEKLVYTGRKDGQK